MKKLLYLCDEPFEVDTKQYKEAVDSGKDIIKWGADNQYPTYLNSLIEKSPTHNALIYLKIKLISAYGLISADWNDDTLLFIRNNSGGSSDCEKLETIISKMASDLVVYGGCALNLRWSKDRTRIAEINFIPLEYLRIQKDGKGYYIGDWTTRNTEKIFYPKFDKRDRSKESTIWLYKEPRTTNYYYPVPEYVAAVELIEIHKKIIQYHNSTISKQFNPLLHISYPSEHMTDDDKEETVKALHTKYSGSVNSGKPIISFPTSPELKPVIEAIPTSDADTKYTQMYDSVRDGIAQAHSVQDKRLVGIETSGKLAGNNDLITAYEAFQVAYVGDKQNEIQSILNEIGRINNLSDKLIIETYRTNLKPDIVIGDFIQLITSALSNEQKVQILITKGYARNEAVALIGIKDTNIQENKTTTN